MLLAHLVNTMPPPPLPVWPSVAPVSPVRPVLSTTPLPPSVEMQRNKPVPYAPMVPSNLNPSRQPRTSLATFPQQRQRPNVPLSNETHTRNKPTATPPKDTAPVLFTDPEFQRDVLEFFTQTNYSVNGQYATQGVRGQPSEYLGCTELTPTYRAGDDDLKVWKKRMEDEGKASESHMRGEGDKGREGGV